MLAQYFVLPKVAPRSLFGLLALFRLEARADLLRQWQAALREVVQRPALAMPQLSGFDDSFRPLAV